MTELLDYVVEAHGGLKRWNGLETISAHLAQSGVTWELVGHKGMLDDVSVTASLHEERASHYPFGAAARSVFTPERVAIENEDGTVTQVLDRPGTSFAGQPPGTPWTVPQLAYFVGTAMWTYLTQPFTFTLPGFETTELEPWQENGETWRRLRVLWPSGYATLNREFTIYVGGDGLLRREDYDVEILGGSKGAHYFSGYTEVSGIMVPTGHRVVPWTPEGQAAEPLLIGIELSAITFA
ncbi:MAG TPA: hypothetical protein VF070_26680 [Streptosporangiaceae bacterium]